MSAASSASSLFRPTDHFLMRARGRGLTAAMIEAIVWFGSEMRAAGALHLTIVRDELHPDELDDPIVQRALDWILVASEDGSSLITCYRRHGAHRFLRFKRDRHRSGRHAPPARR
jgi:hypothetical protein